MSLMNELKRWAQGAKALRVLVLFSFTLLLSGCDLEGDAIEQGYITLSAKLIYPADNAIQALYEVTYKGQDIHTSYFPRTEKEGTLRAVSKETGETELDTMITVGGSERIEFIKLPGKPLEIYHANDYITFSASLSLFDGYRLMLNGQEIVDGVNYLNKKKVNEALTFYKENETEPAYSVEDTEIKNGDKLIFIQSSENEFLSLSNDGDEEEPPLTEYLSKVRFFYSPKGALNVDAIELELISFDSRDVNVIEPITPSVIIEKGKLSSYIELDYAKYKDTYNSPAGFAYSIYAYDIATNRRGALIEDVMNGNNMFEPVRQGTGGSYFCKTKYKFATYQITTNIGYPPKFIMGTEW